MPFARGWLVVLLASARMVVAASGRASGLRAGPVWACAAAPLPDAPSLAAVRALLEERGRCPLAEVGDELRREGLLPEGRLSAFVASCPELALTGRPSKRMVSLSSETTDAALVRTVAGVLAETGPARTAALKLRLRERGRPIPGLLRLLRRHSATFSVERGVVSLCDAGVRVARLADAAPPLMRLQKLALSDRMGGGALPPPSAVREVILVDLDNKAFMLEACAAYAARDGFDACGTLVLGFCATTHNPRLSAAAASELTALSDAGWLRLLTPVRDTANAADFVLAFWVGWLHGQLPPGARFALLSTDIHLDATVIDLLCSQGRDAVSNPDWLRPSL